MWAFHWYQNRRPWMTLNQQGCRALTSALARLSCFGESHESPPLLSSRSAITFLNQRTSPPLADTKSYCLVSETRQRTNVKHLFSAPSTSLLSNPAAEAFWCMARGPRPKQRRTYMYLPVLNLLSHSRYSFTDHLRMEG